MIAISSPFQISSILRFKQYFRSKGLMKAIGLQKKQRPSGQDPLVRSTSGFDGPMQPGIGLDREDSLSSDVS